MITFQAIKTNQFLSINKSLCKMRIKLLRLLKKVKFLAKGQIDAYQLKIISNLNKKRLLKILSSD